mmetsp:Transcript_60399/g.143977  ORF Transcript_60399/g.143977 Transcript_60399/m.143977 type:complete len:1041 (-) Transcript_60399:147-3269(-)
MAVPAGAGRAAMRGLTRARKAVAAAASEAGRARAMYTDALSGANALYLESLYGQWKANPSSLEPKWAEYFQSMESGKAGGPPASGTSMGQAALQAKLSLAASSGGLVSSSSAAVSVAGGMQNLVRAYQKHGHEAADLDPLGLHEWRARKFISPTRLELRPLDPKTHGYSEADLDTPVEFGVGKLPAGAPLRDVLAELKGIYCNKAGFEYMHINDDAKVEWLRTRIESPDYMPKSKEKLVAIYKKLAEVDTFEAFLTTKYKTTKRFGIDGGEAAVVGIDAAIGKAVNMGVTNVVIGMPHRGRLNMLTNVVGKPLVQMFTEFKGTHYDFDKLMETVESEDWAFSGDVKYHLGTSNMRTFPSGAQAEVTLECNPSHLETVNTVTLGRTRAKQYWAGNTPESLKACMPVLFHGDASFAGQGVNYETMQLMHVKEFDTGGTIHVIVNNQIGFTTDPIDDRSTLYCSDLGKAFDCPIIHVNGDDPISVVAAFELAAEFRMTWFTDVILDVVCYRRYGHNETLNPDYTQPVLYKQIAKHPRTEAVFAKSLVDTGIAPAGEIESIKKGVWDHHEKSFVDADTWKGEEIDWVATKWEGFAKPYDESKADPTGVDVDKLTKIGHRLCEVPEGFNLHSGLKRQLKKKREDIDGGKEIDWGTAEALAYGTLLLDGKHVRITGQDVQSGTFAHRHCVIRDQKTVEEYCFLNNLNLGPQENFIARNSILSEYGVLGFETGYSYESPHALVIWEAQFGDFANTAQVMIDQFICAGESKWLQQTGLVMLLPHGYEGQGAEHSSCRLERYLQLCDDDEDDIPSFVTDFGRRQAQKANWQVLNVTTPANVFHAFRRQMVRNFRKPCVIATTKSLFRHKACKSALADMGPGSSFKRVYEERDASIDPKEVTRLVFCTGKVYYDLVAEREALGLKNVAICTVEQIAPFPFDRVLQELKKYDNVDFGDGVHPGSVVWCQEEPKNMGPWFYVKPRLVTVFREGMEKDVVIRYVGRRAAASPATGYPKVHAAEQDALVKEALLGHDDENWKVQRPAGLLGHQT